MLGGSTLTSLPSPSDPYGTWSLNSTLAEETTLSSFQCPAATSSMLREAAGRTTYRWQYAGNFSNVSPLPWQGAYHSSDLAMTFGSHSDFRGPSTEHEYMVSQSMQDHLLAFGRDPVGGPAEIGWQDTSSGLMLRFGEGQEVLKTVTEEDVDAGCDGITA